MLSSLSPNTDRDNRTAVPYTVIVCLVDAAGDVYDTRGIFPGDIGALNDQAQTITDGQLWWDTLDHLQSSVTALYAAHDAIESALMDADFVPGAPA